MKKKLRILFNSNAPWSTSGYGQQMNQFLPLIVKEGYKVGVIAFYGLEGGIIEKDGVTYYPKLASQWGEDAMVDHGTNFKADVVIGLQDIWTLDPNTLKRIKRWIPLVPIDHEPTPPAIKERLKLAYRILAMSKFGHRQMKEEGLHSTYMPHSVDTSMFKPMEKKAIRKQIGMPEDVFVFGMVAANKENPPRKSFQQAMEAFARFHEKHPKSMLYLHTYLETGGKGFPIKEFAKELGISDAISAPNPYELMNLIKTEDMPLVYNMFDCLLAPATNEGFGVPIIEAQACGVPTIVNDFTSMRDLVEDGVNGYKCDVAYKRFGPLLSYVGVPSVDSLYEKMELVYKADHKKMAKNCRKIIKNEYDTQVVFDKHWKPFLEKLEKEVSVS